MNRRPRFVEEFIHGLIEEQLKRGGKVGQVLILAPDANRLVELRQRELVAEHSM